MAKYPELQAFYNSQEWRNFRLVLINQRGLRCEHCGKMVARSDELTLHHIIELTPDNYQDAIIALNPDNIMIVHHGCHNDIHRRTSQVKSQGRGVFIVYGPPLAGKKTYVQQQCWPGDLIVDMDALYAAVSGQPMYDKPEPLLLTVRAAHDRILDTVKTRYGQWDRAWIIGGYPDKYKRDKLALDLGAELVFIQASLEQCLGRLKLDPYRKHKEKEWTGYIAKWFQYYTAGQSPPRSV